MARAHELAPVTASPVSVTRIGPGAFRVQHDGRSDIVYVTGRGVERWIFWNGQVFHAEPHAAGTSGPLTAPLPARVVKVLVRPGDAVRRGDTVVLLEAMKMELPVRA